MSGLRLRDNSGFASVVVALILVLVFSLISLGFAQISRREQQNALNQQLATKASYAAESSINKVLKNIKDVPPISSCNDPAQTTYRVVSLDTNTKITCILVNKSPSSYDAIISPSSGKAFVIETSDTIGAFEFKWKSTNPKYTNPLPDNSKTNIKNDTNYTFPSIVMLGITPLETADDYKRQNLIEQTFYGVLYPSSSSSESVNSNERGKKYLAKCIAGECSTRVAMVGAKSRYLIQFAAPYGGPGDKTNVEVIAYNNSGTQLSTTNTQAEVDVTAKSQDVLKRTKVRVPLSNNLYQNRATSVPSFSLYASSICKRIVTGEDGTSFLDTNNAVANDGSCYPLNDNL